MADHKPEGHPSKGLSIGDIRSPKGGARVLILGREIIRRGIKLIRVRCLESNKEKYLPTSAFDAESI